MAIIYRARRCILYTVGHKPAAGDGPHRGGAPEWRKHVVSYGQGIGSGLNVPVVDLDGDGDLDIVVTGKWGGPVWFENRLKTARN